MNRSVISIEDVDGRTDSFENVLAYEYSRVILGKPSEDPVNWDECTEAYFFDNTRQIHVWREDGQLNAVEISCDGSDEYYVDRKYRILDKLAKGKTLTVREYLKPDEDGQMSVMCTRLISVE